MTPCEVPTFDWLGDNNFHFYNDATSVYISPNSGKNLIKTHTNHGKRTGIPWLYVWHTQNLLIHPELQGHREGKNITHYPARTSPGLGYN